MNRKLLIAIAAAVGILIVIISILLTTQTNNRVPDDISLTPTQGVTPQRRQSTYQEFLNSGRSEICTFSANISGKSSSGTVYAAQGKIRGSFIVPYSGGTFQQHLLVDSYVAYLWTNLDDKGVKFAVEETSANEGLLSQLGNGSGVNYNCKEWKTDLGVFEVPSNIVFLEVNESTLPSALLKETPVPTQQPTIPPAN